MMQSLLTAEIFGLVSMGSIFGVLALMSQVGSGLGPFLIGWAEDATGDYTVPFVITAVTTLVAAVIVLGARSIRPPDADDGLATVERLRTYAG
jgi:cyanate permease